MNIFKHHQKESEQGSIRSLKRFDSINRFYKNHVGHRIFVQNNLNDQSVRNEFNLLPCFNFISIEIINLCDIAVTFVFAV